MIKNVHNHGSISTDLIGLKNQRTNGPVSIHKTQKALFYVSLEQQLILAYKLFSDKQSRNVK